MLILWDEPKRAANVRAHGIDFVEIATAFDFADALVVPSYGERYRATGVLGDRLVTVVFALRGAEALSVISARPASRKERRAYERR